MSNEENLIQNRTDITPEQRRANARKAGLASAAAKKRRKNMKNSMQELLNMEITPAMKAQMQSLGLLDCDWTYADWINVCAMQQAMKGNVRAMEFIRDTAGFNPELALKEQMFEYEKQKEQGAAVEIEDISDVLALIHGYSAWEEILNDGVVCMPIKTITYNFGQKHLDYIKKCHYNTYNIAEGAVRAGKTVDNVIAFAYELCRAPDKFHLATGSTMANAKLNIGDANGFGLEYIFRGQCRWSKYKDNDCLIIRGPYTNFEEKVVIFAGGKSSDSYKKIRGNSYGMWIATEINLHHDNTIKEAFNRQLAAKNRKIFWDLNPDHPKAAIYVDYIDKYAEKAAKGELLGGYNYEHFNIFENINIPKQRIAEIVSQYDKDSIWYIRDIEGKRSIAEGLIYVKLATSIAAEDDEYIVPLEETIDMAKRGEFIELNIGVDFGGNGSGHAFVASGITQGYEKLYVLSSEWHDADGTDPDDLNRMFMKFVEKILDRYGFITNVYCDSAELVLKRGLQKAMIEAELGNINVTNAAKCKITDRIFTMTTLSATGRVFFTPDCESVLEAISMAVWNPKKMELERLDDGTSDIDSLDAMEYSFEKRIKKFIKKTG